MALGQMENCMHYILHFVISRLRVVSIHGFLTRLLISLVLFSFFSATQESALFFFYFFFAYIWGKRDLNLGSPTGQDQTMPLNHMLLAGQ